MKRKYWIGIGAVGSMVMSVLLFQNATVVGSSFDCVNYGAFTIFGTPTGEPSSVFHCKGPVKDLIVAENDVKKFHAKGKAVVCHYFVPRLGSVKELSCRLSPGLPIMSMYQGKEGVPFADLKSAMSLGSASLSSGFYASCLGSASPWRYKAVDLEPIDSVNISVRYSCQHKGGSRGVSAAQYDANTHLKVKQLMESPRRGGYFTGSDGRVYLISDLRMVCTAHMGETVCESTVSATLDLSRSQIVSNL